MSESRNDVPRIGDHAQYVEIDGRRWRASDPSIPASLRSELVHELMDARRAVGAGKRQDDKHAVLRARARVQQAKVALGERGPKWWEPMTDSDQRIRLRAAILALLEHRAERSSICPSDAARAAGGALWRDLMDLARAEAFALQREQRVEVRQAGEPVADLTAVSGPLRLARGSAFSDLADT